MGPGFLPYMLTLKNSLKTQALQRQASEFHRDKMTQFPKQNGTVYPVHTKCTQKALTLSTAESRGRRNSQQCEV